MNELPDEVLVHICSYLPTADFLNLARVSHRFDRILCEKRLISKLDFRRCYLMTSNALKLFLSHKIRYTNIREVNFNGCWWMTFTQLKVLAKLSNLKALHLLQCRVTWDLLPQLISNLHLETFSWTWTERNSPSITPSEFLETLQPLLAELKNLFLEVSNPFHLTYVWCTLAYTSKLEILEISEVKADEGGVRSAFQGLRSWNQSSGVVTHKLSCLKECKIFLRSSVGFTIKDFIMRIFLASFAPDSNISGFWASEAGCKALAELNANRETTLNKIQYSEFLSLSGKHARFLNPPDASDNHSAFAKSVLKNTLPNCKCLSLDMQRVDGDLMQLIGSACPRLECLSMVHAYFREMPLNRFGTMLESCNTISELCLYNTCFHFRENPCIAISKLTNLKILSLSTCVLGLIPNISEGMNANREQEIRPFGVQQRRGLPSRPTDIEIQTSRLYPIAANCRKIHTLIIRREERQAITSSCDTYISAIKDSALFCVAQMKCLVKLELGEMPRLHNGQFLPEICQQCKIEDFRLIDIGSKSSMVYHNSLISALNLCTELKHLKIEQKYDVRIVSLKDSLLKCKKLESLEIISEGGQHSRFDQNPIIEVVRELPELMHLHLIQPITKEDCKKTKKILVKMFKDIRPAFQCEIACCQRTNLINEFRKFPLYFKNE